jgi:hypothetical protein
MKTIAEVINSAKIGAIITDGRRKWKVIKYEGGKLAMPVRMTKGSFELWGMCRLEQVAIIPGLRILK